jgi:hypothetical protein
MGLDEDLGDLRVNACLPTGQGRRKTLRALNSLGADDINQ